MRYFDARETDEKRHRGRHSLLQARFHRPQDALFLALREPYLRTAVPIAAWALQRIDEVVAAANERLQNVRVGRTAAERLDYQVAKRCIEGRRLKVVCHRQQGRRAAKRPLWLFAEEIFYGSTWTARRVNIESDYVENEQPEWKISERVARLVIGSGGSLCEALSNELDRLDMKRRIRVVERLARYLTYKQMPYIVDLLGCARAGGLSMDPIESIALLEFVDQFWQMDAGKQWLERLRLFLEYFVERPPEQQDDILDGPIKTGDFVRDTEDEKARERLVEAFNTPLYPMVLIANEVMQEGIDLQKNCRRVVHHDLLWNPAQIEQRIGRIDRLGSLTSRLRSLRSGRKT